MAKTIQSRAEQTLSTYRQMRECYRLLAQLHTAMLTDIAEVVKVYRGTGVMLPIPNGDSVLVNQIKQDVDRLQQQLCQLRRNYPIARALGKSWEDGLRSELALRHDTKIEFVPKSYEHGFRVVKPIKHEFTRTVTEYPTIIVPEIIELELREWANPITRERRYIAFSDELNVLYLRAKDS